MLIGALPQYFFGIAIFVSSLFLILLVLVQRGRGGGLTGALGGPGGQSAFGTKAGDLFTRITVAVAAVWIVLCASAVFFLKSRALPSLSGGSNTSVSSDIGGTAGSEGDSSGITTDPDGNGIGSGGAGLGSSTTGMDFPAISLPSGSGTDAPAAADGSEPSEDGQNADAAVVDDGAGGSEPTGGDAGTNSDTDVQAEINSLPSEGDGPQDGS